MERNISEIKLNVIEQLGSLSEQKIREVEAEIRGYIRGREDERKEM